jgi:hypothetical protein
MNRLFSLLMFLTVILVACSSNSHESKDSTIAGDMADTDRSFIPSTELTDESGLSDEEKATPEEQTAQANGNEDRKVIYDVNLTLEVKNISKALSEVTNLSERFAGYTVDSFIENNGEQQYSYLTVRIPSEKLHEFLNEVEAISEKVQEKQITGSDVTEEYTDLQSRLKAKKAVEERLLSFLKDATKTEDLLKISQDLSVVQEEIEQLEGRIKYLNNRTEYATITIYLTDVSVNIPEIGNDDLQTGERIKQAFAESLNFLYRLCSNVAVLFIGYSIFVIPVLLIAGFIWYKIRKKKRHEEQ